MPAVLAWFVWQAISPQFVMSSIANLPAIQQLPASDFERQTVLADAWRLAGDPGAGSFYPLAQQLAGPIAQARSHYAMIGGAIAFIVAFAGGAYGYSRLRAGFPARTRIERGIMLLLLLASLLAILTTFGIIASLVYETSLFFQVRFTDQFHYRHALESGHRLRRRSGR